MSVCQRKTGAYVVKYKEGNTWKQKQFKDLNKATEFDRNARLAYQSSDPLSLSEAVLVYLQNNDICSVHIKGLKRLFTGFDKNGEHIDGYAQHLADKYVHMLTRQDLESVRQRILSMGNKPITANMYVSNLNAAINWCVAEDLVALNPWAKYKALQVHEKNSRSGTLEQFAAIYEVLSEYMRWAVQTMLALCLRPGASEVNNLEWSVFNWRDRTATVYMPKVKYYKTVFVPDWYLSEAYARFSAGQKYVLVGQHGQRFIFPTIGTHWYNACRKCGVHIPMYAIRHIAASEMLSNGSDIASVAAQLGHRKISTTADFYTHALARGQRLAAAQLPNIRQTPPTPLVAIGGVLDSNS